jgi:hypothetical protein
MYPEMKQGRMLNSYGPDCVITLVDPDDIGAFAVAAFDDPVKFGGQSITVVSENMRFDNLMKELSNAYGHPFEVVYRTEEETKSQMDNVFVSGQVICRGVEKLVNMEEVKSWDIPLTSFKQFLEKHKQELRKGTFSGDETTTEPFSVSQMMGSKTRNPSRRGMMSCFGTSQGSNASVSTQPQGFTYSGSRILRPLMCLT